MFPVLSSLKVRFWERIVCLEEARHEALVGTQEAPMAHSHAEMAALGGLHCLHTMTTLFCNPKANVCALFSCFCLKCVNVCGPPSTPETPKNSKSLRSDSGVRKRVVSKRVVSADVPPERKPERGYVRQNHPFTKPPSYLPVID